MRHPLEPTLYRQVRVEAFDRKGFEPLKGSSVLAGSNSIRCPACQWQPERGSRWFCLPLGAPEYFLGGCGTTWNTFDTRGRCPGCRYQWQFTTCLKCGVTSRHEDWYEKV